MKIWKLGLASALAFAPLMPLNAQPPAKAEVAPQPPEKIKKPRAPRPPRPPRAPKIQAPRVDQLVKNFEVMFGRKLTEDESAQLQKATDERQAAMKAAQEQWRAQFLKITGVTEAQLKGKQKEMRKKNKAEPRPAEKPAEPAVNAHDTNAPAAEMVAPVR